MASEFDKLLKLIQANVKGFERVVPVSVADLGHVEALKTEGIPGVYGVCEGANVLYIGQTSNLKDRIKKLTKPSGKHTFKTKLAIKHGEHRRFNSKADYVKYFAEHWRVKVLPTSSVPEAIMLEGVLIYMLNPPYNKETSKEVQEREERF